MKVAALTLSISRQAAGMLDCVRRPMQEMQKQEGLEIEVLSLRDDQTDCDKASWSPVPVSIFSALGPNKLAFAPSIAAYLRKNTFDLVHTFGLWTYLSQIAHSWSSRSRRPYMVSPQGMLDPWALANSRWRKRLVGILYEYSHLRDAFCIQATCQAELKAFRSFGLRNPICVIANGVDLPKDSELTDLRAAPGLYVPGRQKVLLYLSRIHPKKGLPVLLQAWARIASQNRSLVQGWRLRIAGWDQGGHEETLRALVQELDLERVVEFAGPLYGEAKAEAFRAADAFVLPSFSEGLPLSVLEAWSYRLPVLMTPECNIPAGFSCEAAFYANPNVNSLAIALDSLFRATASELRCMGDRGRLLVENNFTWSRAANEMSAVYRWLSGGGSRPPCVIA